MRKLDRWILSLSGLAELVIVLLALGWFIFLSVRWFLANLLAMAYHDVPPWPVYFSFTQEYLGRLVLQEVSMLLAVGWFLWRRGWTLIQLGLGGPRSLIHPRLSSKIIKPMLWGLGVALSSVGLAVAAKVGIVLIPRMLIPVMPDVLLMTTVFLRVEQTVTL